MCIYHHPQLLSHRQIGKEITNCDIWCPILKPAKLLCMSNVTAKSYNKLHLQYSNILEAFVVHCFVEAV